MARHELRIGTLLVALVEDTRENGDQVFTLEVARMHEERIETAAETSGLTVDASPDVIAGYLSAAMTEAQVAAATGERLHRVATRAARMALAAVAPQDIIAVQVCIACGPFLDETGKDGQRVRCQRCNESWPKACCSPCESAQRHLARAASACACACAA